MSIETGCSILVDPVNFVLDFLAHLLEKGLNIEPSIVKVLPFQVTIMQ